MKDTQGEHRDKMVDAYSVCFIGSQIENTSVFCLIRLVKLLHFDMVEPKGLARSATGFFPIRYVQGQNDTIFFRLSSILNH